MLNIRPGKRRSSRISGFSILEILIVVTIIGVMLVIIVPRGYRASVDAKYNMVRQAASELGKWGVTWATRQLESQNPATDTCKLDDYVATLQGFIPDPNANWLNAVVPIGSCKTSNGGLPTASVKGVMPEEQQPRNPFNGASYFVLSNFPFPSSSIGPGILGLIRVDTATGPYSQTNPHQYSYYFLFLGTESTTPTDFYGCTGGLTLENIRTGVFMIRTTNW